MSAIVLQYPKFHSLPSFIHRIFIEPSTTVGTWDSEVKKRASSCHLRVLFLPGDEYVTCEVVVRAKKKRNLAGRTEWGKKCYLRRVGRAS